MAYENLLPTEIEVLKYGEKRAVVDVPLTYIARETGLTTQRILEALKSLRDRNLIDMDKIGNTYFWRVRRKRANVTALTVDAFRFQLDRWKAAADRAGKPSVASWARDVLNAAARGDKVTPKFSTR